MKRTTKANQYYKPSEGSHNVEIKNIHETQEKNGKKKTRWEFSEMVDGNVEVFSLFLFENEEATILNAFGIEALNGVINWDDEVLIGKPLTLDIKHNGDFINLKGVKVNKIESESIPF